jgi:hypothetical protein
MKMLMNNSKSMLGFHVVLVIVSLQEQNSYIFDLRSRRVGGSYSLSVS